MSNVNCVQEELRLLHHQKYNLKPPETPATTAGRHEARGNLLCSLVRDKRPA